jgi:hypothetical protein
VGRGGEDFSGGSGGGGGMRERPGVVVLVGRRVLRAALSSYNGQGFLVRVLVCSSPQY